MIMRNLARSDLLRENAPGKTESGLAAKLAPQINRKIANGSDRAVDIAHG